MLLGKVGVLHRAEVESIVPPSALKFFVQELAVASSWSKNKLRFSALNEHFVSCKLQL